MFKWLKKMAEKKKSFWDNPFGGIFDFNNDDKENLGELWIAQKIFEECTKENETQHNCYNSILDDNLDDISWREFYEDGSDFDIYPEDYETEEEYDEALKEAQANEFGDISAPAISLHLSLERPALAKLDEIKEESYPNKRRFNAACTLANEFICYNDDIYEKRENAWRLSVPDGKKYGLNPCCYDTEQNILRYSMKKNIVGVNGTRAMIFLAYGTLRQVRRSNRH